jgi:hypothetical protein
MGDPGIVEGHVDPTVALFDICHYLGNEFRIRNIALNKFDPEAFRCRVTVLDIDIDNYDLGTVFEKSFGRLETNAASAAGNHGDSAIQRS